MLHRLGAMVAALTPLSVWAVATQARLWGLAPMLLMLVVLLWGTRKTLAQHLFGKVELQDTNYSLDEEGFEVTAGGRCERYAWTATRWFVEVPIAFVLYAPTPCVLLKRAFAEHDLARVRSLLVAKRGPSRRRVLLGFAVGVLAGIAFVIGGIFVHR